MSLKTVDNYTIGLDLGTGSVGWAVVGDDGKLLHTSKGKPAWGSRLFPNAETAASTRLIRGQRRRYDRRRQRVDCLQSIFADEMANVDNEFFIRLRQSRLLEKDRDAHYSTDYVWPLFNDDDFTEKQYYERFPTIWHLRRFLMESDEKADVRLVYLAFHNIVKYRGNFLQEDNPSLRAKNANARSASADLCNALWEYFSAETADESEVSPVDAGDVQSVLENQQLTRGEKQDRLQDAFRLVMSNSQAKNLAKACTGAKAEFSALFDGMEKTDISNFSLSDDEKADSFAEICGDEELVVFRAIQSVHSAYVLSSLLQGCSSLSEAMIASYEQHKADLSKVKYLVKKYLGIDVYRDLFRGPKTPDGRYDINRLPKDSYTGYILGEKLCNNKGTTQEDFIRHLQKLFSNCSVIQEDEVFKEIQERLYANDGKFLAKQKTRANGAIPYQLHLEEMETILVKQGVYYPFLLDNEELLKKLVSKRIPYYVGPLNNGHDPDSPYPGNIVNTNRKFGWSVRKEGKEHVKAYPWNVDEVIDTDKTAELFIQRMTGTCTYLYGEPVLPRHSLLYEEFCVLNELNSARWCEQGKEAHRFDHKDRIDLVEELFKSRKSVNHRVVTQWLERREGVSNAVISSTQAESGFESKLGSYYDFCKILKVNRLEDDDCPLSIDQIEQIILWNTVFEDRAILKRKLRQEFGAVLDDAQINKIVKIRYTGWGRLSKKFLTGLKAETVQGSMSILDVMREGDPITGHHFQAMNLMETLREEKLGFQQLVDETNEEYFKSHNTQLCVDDMQGSPALRRSVNQALRIIEEIVSISGKPPKRICIESTREEDPRRKGKRTDTRYKKLKDAIKQLKGDAAQFDPELLDDLEDKKERLDDERLVLYFMQNGKSLYSGKSLDINKLSSYQVDHILPQSYIKDDSFDNKALVLQEENQRKLNSLLLDESIIRKCRNWWSELHRAGLISDKKFKNLTCTSISDRMLTGFINRQLVETSQIVKFVRQICEQRYPNTEIISVRASLSHGVREKFGFVKCRAMNDYHHAHDAYLACQVARFMSVRFPKWQDGFELTIIRNYVKQLAEKYQQNRRTPGDAGFIIDSFARDYIDAETGEIVWDHEAEAGRMRKELSYRDCFISRMLEEQTGAFWDQTIYSPRDKKNGKNLQVPLKQSGAEGFLNPKDYGGVRSARNAYFFIFAAKDKKDNYKFFFEGVPVYLVSKIKSSPDALHEHAESLAQQAGCHNAKILRKKVPLRQKLEIDGSVFTLGGRTGSKNVLRAGVEIAGSIHLAKLLNLILQGNLEFSSIEYDVVFGDLILSISKTCPALFSALKLENCRDKFDVLDSSEKIQVLLNVVNSANGINQNCDLSLLGRSKQSAFMMKNIASNLPKITWIDSSVTGMIEKRTTFEDLTRGL